MKTFVQSAGILILIILTIFFMSGKFSSTTSEIELQNVLDKAVDHALYVAMSNNVYTIDSKDELAADIMHELFTNCNIKADYKIAFNVIDLENGMVDVQVTQSVYVSPLMHSEVTCRRTVIFEDNVSTLGGSEYGEVPENVTDFYTYTLNNAGTGYVLALTDEFKTALNSNTDYVLDGETLWTAQSALPNPGSTYAGGRVVSMLRLFDSSTVTSLDLSGWDTSNVTNMQYMFYNCTALAELDLSSFDTSSVTTMWGMFSNCTTLTDLDLSSFDTSNATSLREMFYNCTALAELDLSSFDTSSATSSTSMRNMFNNCTALTSVIARTDEDKTKFESSTNFPSSCTVTVISASGSDS